MKTKLWIITAISTMLIGTRLAAAKLNVLVAQITEARHAVKAADSSRNVPIALKGTALMAHPEVIEDVDGRSFDKIDKSQYTQIRQYFLRRIAETPAKRDRLWKVNYSSRITYKSSVREHRQDLKKMLGLVELSPQKPIVKVLQESQGMRVEDVEITLQGQWGFRALVFVPEVSSRQAAVIAIPGAYQSPEDFAVIAEGMTTARWLRVLLARGVAVAIPEMVERSVDVPISQDPREYNRRRILWRLGFLVGRTLVGIEVQQVEALENYLAVQPEIDPKRIGVWGGGQAGMTALFAAAVDEHLAAATVQDYFNQQEECWKEPVDRVIYGRLNEFGDAEVAALIAPRPLAIVTKSGGPVSFESVKVELGRAGRFYEGLGVGSKLAAMYEANGADAASALEIASELGAKPEGKLPQITVRLSRKQISSERNEHFEGMYHYLRGICAASAEVRRQYWKLDSTPSQERPQKAVNLRRELARFMGVIPKSNIPLNPRTILIGETNKFLAYDVLLDVLPGVQAYGQLLVPRSVARQAQERLPAVICQHGFGRAPKYVTGMTTNLQGDQPFGERLAERGYVVFAPYLTVPSDSQSPDWVHRADLINPIVRMASALGMMRTSLELAKLHRIVDFLQSLPFVNGNRIGYYGISYGGYSAIWMSPLEPRLKFTIISGYFNDRLKDLTSVSNCIYWCFPDTDFYNWNLLNRFSDLELIAAMWPRPVCLEWGLYDMTTTPTWHREAWREVKKFAEAWGIEDKIVSDDFIGPHSIHGIGTFFFIDRWLRPDRSAGRDYGCDDEDYCNKDVAPGLHGYAPSSEIPYVTHEVSSSKESWILGRFYVSDVSPEMEGIALKLSRVGNPEDLVVELGSREGEDDLGELRLNSKEVTPEHGLWYELKLKQAVHLDPHKLYWFRCKALPGAEPQAAYTVYGPKPLKGEDYPRNFGLSFRILTKGEK